MVEGQIVGFGKVQKTVHKGRLSWKTFVKWAASLASGVDFLRRINILHRDLATRNIMLKNCERLKENRRHMGQEDVAKQNSYDFQAFRLTPVIIDFGLAKIVKPDLVSNKLINPAFELKAGEVLPLESLTPEFFSNTIFTFKSEIWSFGVVCWHMMHYCAHEPYQEELLKISALNRYEKLKIFVSQERKILNFRIQPPAGILKIVKLCLSYDPDNRPSARVLHDQFLKILNSKSEFLDTKIPREEDKRHRQVRGQHDPCVIS